MAVHVEPPGRASPEQMVSELVRRIAWGGDRRRGTLRIELGGTHFAGASVVVHAEDRELRLELEAPAGMDAAELAERLRGRLEGGALSVRAVSVRCSAGGR